MQGNGQFACRLHHIHMHTGTRLPGGAGKRTHRLNNTRFVVSPGKAHSIVSRQQLTPLGHIGLAIGQHGCCLTLSGAQRGRMLGSQREHIAEL